MLEEKISKTSRRIVGLGVGWYSAVASDKEDTKYGVKKVTPSRFEMEGEGVRETDDVARR